MRKKILKDGRAFWEEVENDFISAEGAYKKRHKECKEHVGGQQANLNCSERMWENNNDVA